MADQNKPNPNDKPTDPARPQQDAPVNPNPAQPR